MKREYLVVVNGQPIRDSNDRPMRFSKLVAEANVKIRDNAYIQKIGKDCVLGSN